MHNAGTNHESYLHNQGSCSQMPRVTAWGCIGMLYPGTRPTWAGHHRHRTFLLGNSPMSSHVSNRARVGWQTHIVGQHTCLSEIRGCQLSLRRPDR